MPASVTNTFAPATLIESSEANQNFQDLVTYINTQLVLKDGSVAFTAVPSGPALDPTSANQLTRKAYVDQIGQVSQLSLGASSASWNTDAITDMALNNVPVVAGRLYAIHLHTQVNFASVASAARWDINCNLNGSLFKRFGTLQPAATGTSVWTVDWFIYWQPSVTQATDDLVVAVVENTNGADIQFTASGTVPRTLTLIDLGV